MNLLPPTEKRLATFTLYSKSTESQFVLV